ncbi:UDP-glucose:Glyco protein glucosyltransferase-domain-containing protein [Rhizophagus clarus]|uniref:UDP-glucose:Glyco protein glucosyltransferase-domain-containing protein n=1 Tax=Rhizophagus clarus TaxID=94130 RepID=A0A8H3L9K2_9GLOM|nr:UDP-glucose:Glyco protein glucosyltransferase-domain-containing protein [Rhizophagus clarus]
MVLKKLRYNTLLLVSYLFCIIFIVSKAETPPVQTWLKTSWDAPHLLLEIIESVSIDNSTAYYPLINEFINQGLFSSELTYHEVYNAALDVIESKQYLSTPTSISILEFSLSLHTTAPAIQAYYHYYNTTVVPSKQEFDVNFNPECEVWVDWHGHQACNVENFKKLTGISKTGSFDKLPNSSDQHPKLLSFDHVLSSNAGTTKPLIILYADISSPSFVPFHQFITDLVNNEKAEYVLRYKPPKGSQNSLYLAGYGVELALKKTDYIVIDDRKVESDDHNEKENENSESYNDSHSDKLNEHLFDEDISEIKPLTTSAIKDLGLKATQFIISSPNPLSTLAQLSQNLPKYSYHIAQLNLNSSLKQEIKINQNYVGLDSNSFWLNGLTVDPSSVDPFSLLKLLRRERQNVLSLMSLNMTSRQAVELLASPIILELKSSQDLVKGIFDVRDKSEKKNIITWFNDIEKDKRYKNWPPRMFDILQPIYPGQMRYIRKNLFNVLFVIDLSSMKGLEIINDTKMFIERNIPIRFGLIPLVIKEKNESIIMAKIFYYLIDQYTIPSIMQFFSEVLNELKNSPSANIVKIAEKQFNKVTNDQTPKDETSVKSFDYFTKSDTESSLEEQISGATEFINKFRINADGKGKGALFVNGKYFDIDDNYQRDMVQTITEHTVFIQQKVYVGEISDHTDIFEYFMTLPRVPSRRNPHVFVSDSQPLNVINLVDKKHESDEKLNNIRYIYSTKQDDNEVPISLLLITNFDSEYGARQGLEALKYLDESSNVRIAFIHNPSTQPSAREDISLSSFIYFILHSSEANTVDMPDLPKILKEAIEEYLNIEDNIKMPFIEQTESQEIPIPDSESINPARSFGWQFADKVKSQTYWKEWNSLTRKTLKLNENDTAIIVNGRVVGPFIKEDLFIVDDFRLLIDIEFSERIEPVINAAKAANLTVQLNRSNYSDFISKATSIIATSMISDVPLGLFGGQDLKRDLSFKKLKSEHSKIVIGDTEAALYKISVLIDPLSETAQKWSTILEILSQIDGVAIELYFNPKMNLVEIPIKRFYRYVLEPKLKFNTTTGNLIAPSAHFSNLPEDPLLTLGMDVIQAWLVTPKVSIHDLDNIRLANLDSRLRIKGVESVFELKNILIEGHARDMTLQAPPSGLQIVLGTKNNPVMVDTIVMANLGYLQLKANPGIWTFSLREGKSSEIFNIQSVGSEGWFTRKPGKENEDVLKFEEKDGIWNYFVNKFSKNVSKNKAEINIFSVASGHLYERFLSIMILSVLKHTKSRVKFWFIENFLSPSFKDFIPHMAKEYNFEYELVTYKWPHWLRAQKEKQRTIWGYKILFLDVLFPLDLDKVIFVDADQIVRADLKELVDMDLQGAPYGYTPFCDNRPEMDGFRFWKHGYWKDHLKGKSYHISALYVVDLQRFRHMAAGDQIRGQYQSLSIDPNSLANLDQDLPNNMQHIVPIFSLPLEWLWCETWCSDESFERARTIDLCNNPLTKEPKLDRARRQVPEWESYDKEVATFAARISQLQKVLITESNIQSKSTIEVSSKSEIPVKTTTHEDL